MLQIACKTTGPGHSSGDPFHGGSGVGTRDTGAYIYIYIHIITYSYMTDFSKGIFLQCSCLYKKLCFFLLGAAADVGSDSKFFQASMLRTTAQLSSRNSEKLPRLEMTRQLHTRHTMFPMVLLLLSQATVTLPFQHLHQVHINHMNVHIRETQSMKLSRPEKLANMQLLPLDMASIILVALHTTQ